MTWKNAFIRAVKKEFQPMRQMTYWIVFLSCGAAYVMITVSSSAIASYNIIIQNPEIVSTSWLISGFF